MFQTSLLRDKLCKKVYIACSFLFGVGVIEPRVIEGEVKIDYGVDIGAEECLENELTNILISIFIQTELLHVKNLDRCVFLDDLTEQTYH